ncbi:putative pentatricopeptide repeat-containing protein At3g23330 [Aristolochia californica]|uniref:putative pentatricopeptide repeat-containing protein At3g23330 n=1 Tax=Aristolochia californica TaxID=171875 RepID=UPI0035D9B0AF
MLQKCVSNRSLVNGQAVHGHVIKCGIKPDSHLWSCLVSMYAKCGDIFCVQQLFSQMPQEDAIVGWHALINGLVIEGNGEEAVLLFSEMLKTGVQPNKFIYATGLKACSMCCFLNVSEQMHGQVIKFGISSYLYVGSALVDVYAKKSEMEIAKEVFVRMRQHNAVSWNSLLNGYVRIGNGKEVLKLFFQMTEADIRLSKFTLSSVIKACANLGNAREGRGIHGLAIKIGSVLDRFLSTSLIDMYSKCELADDAYKAFIGIEYPDVVAWSSIISCFDQCGYAVEAAELFDSMRKMGVWPNEYTLSSLVSSATDLEDMRYGQSLHAYIIKLRFDINNSVCNALVTMYMKNGFSQDGFKIFNALRDRDVVSWNALLLGFHDGSGSETGWKIFNAMLLESLKPNKYTFISVLRSCTNLSRLNQGKQAHAYIMKNGLDEDSFVGTTLVDMYANCGDVGSAHQVFDSLNGRDVFTWTVIIAGYAHIDQGEMAIRIFCQMRREGIKANEYTFASCLKACSSLAALISGCQVHAQVTKMGMLADGFVASALIDMYGKCGCLKEFERVFDEATTRDVVLWNTIICGYSHHGLGLKALEAFQLMLEEGLWPDDITFIGVLSACARRGLIKEGQCHFESLSKVYGVTPTMEHHACMIDILGKAANFNKIEHLIAKMPFVPNSLIWQTVLGACTVHGNVELGERAAEKLFELEPHKDSTYILLSNIYAAKRRWDDVLKVRIMMQNQRVKKEPGCSWIEVNGQVHVFIPQDRSHQKTAEIYAKLEELGRELTLRGYTPRTDEVLHNVDEDEKKESLLYHSERLTLAYGLISMNPGRSIQIFKNLRICKDCHSAFKLFSDITSREIVVRDIGRFHHFQNGSCSCADYW